MIKERKDESGQKIIREKRESVHKNFPLFINGNQNNGFSDFLNVYAFPSKFKFFGQPYGLTSSINE